MGLKGRPIGIGAPDRIQFSVYALPRTQLLMRILAESQGKTIGGYVDELIAREAERQGVSLGRLDPALSA